ncbi:RadC family protein [Phenylobacterium sp.]|uniref:JAB domain-containing protein n=1 Tax=Phenylobacterium sp. TaxID=1871053 RepID=UPI0035667577
MPSQVLSLRLEPEDAPLETRGRLEALALTPGEIALDDAQCLALLCGGDLDVADVLLAAFGSLPEVLGAAAGDLVRVAGRSAAARLRLVRELARRMLIRPLRTRPVLSSSQAVCDYLRTALTGAPREQFRVLFLDRRHHLIADELQNEGTVDHAPVYPREVMRRSLELHASALLIVHNHPAQDPTPSAAAVDMTWQLIEAGRHLRIVIHDHMIVAGQQVVSLKSLGLL